MGWEEVEPKWQQLAAEVLAGMKEWRLQHPQATLQEIEAALDARLSGLRARLLQDVALASATATFSRAPASARPRCPTCGTALVARGAKTRHLETHGGREIALTRTYGVCPACQTGLFPPGSGAGAAAGPSDPAVAGAPDPPGELDPL